MSATNVNISVNSSFVTRASQLLTGNYHFIHSLLTELSTTANEQCQQLKRKSAITQVIAQHNDLTRAALTGYRAALEDTGMPKPTDVPADCEQHVKHLIPPYKALGYAVGCSVIELLIRKGAHRSTPRGSPPRRDDPPEQYTGPSPCDAS